MLWEYADSTEIKTRIAMEMESYNKETRLLCRIKRVDGQNKKDALKRVKDFQRRSKENNNWIGDII